MDNHYNVVIVGGGVAGVLAAAKIYDSNKELSLLLLEKETVLGGRLKPQNLEAGHFGCGFSTIHERLFDHWNQILKKDPSADDLPSFVTEVVQRAGILAGNKLNQLDALQLFSADGAHAIAGSAAVRDWSKIEQVIEKLEAGKGKDQTFAQIWSGTKKDPSSMILGLLGCLWGIPDIWSVNADALLQILGGFREKHYFGNWKNAIEATLSEAVQSGKVVVHTKCRVANTKTTDKGWAIHSERGGFSCDHLVVAVPPWEALSFLSKDEMPQAVVQLCSRVRPVSAVTLSEKITQKNMEHCDLPQITLVPSEQTQVIYDKNNDAICFQATLDFELMMQAPDVIKAVKRLKRARKKLLSAYPEFVSEGEHIALKTVAWACLPTQQNLKYTKKLEDQTYQSSSLTFCGDAYGAENQGDCNIVASIEAAVPLAAKIQ